MPDINLGFNGVSTRPSEEGLLRTIAAPKGTETGAPPPTPPVGNRGHVGIGATLGGVIGVRGSYNSPNTNQYTPPANVAAIEGRNPTVLALPSTARIPAITQFSHSTSAASSSSVPVPASEWEAITTYLKSKESDLLAGQVCGRDGKPTNVMVMSGEDGFGLENGRFPEFAKVVSYFVAKESVLTKKVGSGPTTAYTSVTLPNGDTAFDPADPRVSIARKDVSNDPNRYEIGISVPVAGITDSDTKQKAQFGMYIRFTRNPADGSISNVKIGLGAANSRICASLILGALTGQIDPRQNQQAAMAIAGYKHFIQQPDNSRPGVVTPGVSAVDSDRLLQNFAANKSIELSSTDPLKTQHTTAMERLYKYACKTVFAEAFPKMVETALEATARAAESMKTGRKANRMAPSDELKKLEDRVTDARAAAAKAANDLAALEAQFGIPSSTPGPKDQNPPHPQPASPPSQQKGK